MEYFLYSKPAEFYLSGIKTLSDKWQVVIQNNYEYTINWNLFIVKSFMNL